MPLSRPLLAHTSEPLAKYHYWAVLAISWSCGALNAEQLSMEGQRFERYYEMTV